MQRITRYVLLELLSVFSLTLIGVTVVMVLGVIAREVVRQGLGLMPILRLIPYALPGALRFSVPATMLLATCSLFGRMSADNEVTAIKSLGISPAVIVTPVLGLALLMSLLAVWLSDVAVTWGTRGMQQVVVESVEGIVYRMLKTQGHYSTPRLSINVRDVVGKRLLRPTVVFRATDDDAEIRLVAREAELRTNLKDQTLSIFLTDGTIEADNQVSMTDPETFEQVIPLQDATRRERRALSPSQVAFQDISQEVLQQRQSLHTLEQQMAAQAAFAMVLGDFPSLGDRSWQAWQHQHADSASRLNKLQLEPWRRLAEGFSCLFFVLVGAPLAIRMRSANLFTTFAACFVPILFVYYPLLTYAVERAKEGMAPPYAVWSGNGVLLCAGLWLMRRVVRY